MWRPSLLVGPIHWLLLSTLPSCQKKSVKFVKKKIQKTTSCKNKMKPLYFLHTNVSHFTSLSFNGTQLPRVISPHYSITFETLILSERDSHFTSFFFRNCNQSMSNQQTITYVTTISRKLGQSSEMKLPSYSIILLSFLTSCK